MPNIIGILNPVSTSVSPLDVHIGHLRHLKNQKIAKDLLKEKHKLTAPQVIDTYKVFASHIGQAIEFHEESKSANLKIKPVLQYYSYLNLSVSVILAYRPNNFNQYRRHGVEDKTHSISKLDLSSEVIKINRGAVPIFHSILSDVPLVNKKFRLGQLLSGFQMTHHEISAYFDKKVHSYSVEDQVVKDGNKWRSTFMFRNERASGKVPKKTIENAMPVLISDYIIQTNKNELLHYVSKKTWRTSQQAEVAHKIIGIKLINYGGHRVIDGTRYSWHGVQNTPLMPTLSSILLTSFSLASIVRYRPLLLESAMNSPVALVLDTFTAEADSSFIPSIRNMLYREELAIGHHNFL